MPKRGVQHCDMGEKISFPIGRTWTFSPKYSEEKKKRQFGFVNCSQVKQTYEQLFRQKRLKYDVLKTQKNPLGTVNIIVLILSYYNLLGHI